MAVWKDNPDLIDRLIQAQNHRANITVDVMTFAGFCEDRAELLQHVERCEAAIPRFEAAGRTHSGAPALGNRP